MLRLHTDAIFAAVGDQVYTGPLREPRLIADCSGNLDFPADERIANARLFAAAPELLEACEAALFYYSDEPDPDSTQISLILKLKEAIEKASEGV